IQGSETCDGTEDSACPGECGADCTCPLCPHGGQSVEGVCWYAGSDGESCDQTCAAAGMTCDSATITYAGSAGTAAHCDAVLAALTTHPSYGYIYETDCTYWGNPGLGCWWFPFDSARVYTRCTTPATTCDAAQVLFGSGPSSGSRACACS